MENMGNDSYTLGVKSNFSLIKNFTIFSVIALALMSAGYFTFWIGAISDELFFEYGKKIFEPLASFLNTGNVSIDAYLNTSLILLGIIFPVLIAQYLFDKFEETLINIHNSKKQKEQQKELLEEHKNYMSRFDSIKTYSICLSLDYESEKQISIQSKKALNQAIYSKIASILKSIEPNGKVTYDDVLIFRAQNFSNYDFVYDSILNGLSKIKNVISQKYNCKIIPSITTDAYSGTIAETSIRKQHFEIQSFNFKNRALSTASFANKYKHLQQEKYIGVPIGEFVYFGNEKMGTYELNVIHKNLSKALA